MMAASKYFRLVVFSCLTLSALVTSQTIAESDGYTGYTLELRGENDNSVVYETENTDTSNGAILNAPPDVYLNASLHVGEIDIEVANLSAKINIDAQVLNLLKFNAGVDVSISRVNLNIQNVTAKLLLEARLGTLVAMINDTLDSIDLNPIIASLGNNVGELLNGTASALGGSSSGPSSGSGSNATLSSRSTQLSSNGVAHNVLYSVNSYTQNTHTNYLLSQSGDIVAQSLHNDGTIYGTETVGSYWHEMTPTGHENSVMLDGQMVVEKEYSYEPFIGLDVVSAIYVDQSGNVVATKVLSESGGGGSSTITDD